MNVEDYAVFVFAVVPTELWPEVKARVDEMGQEAKEWCDDDSATDGACQRLGTALLSLT